MQRYEEFFTYSGFYAEKLLFEMLVVFQRAPRPTPAESVLNEKAVAEVLLCNLVFKRFRAVCIGFARCRLNKQRAVFLTLYTGVIQRIDIDGESTCMV